MSNSLSVIALENFGKTAFRVTTTPIFEEGVNED
jgi:hypothetical protein